ncbi:MAG: glycoside hydrolase domain-containing protein [Planctomycetota bacterium]
MWNRFLLSLGLVGLSLSGFVFPAPAAEAPASPEAGPVILNNNAIWRACVVSETEEVQLPSKEVGHFRLEYKPSLLSSLPAGTNVLAPDQFKAEKVAMRRLPEETSPDWMKPEFDDSDWMRSAAPILNNGSGVGWKLIFLRGRFQVNEPSDLKLSLTYKGGIRVYLNGEELISKDISESTKGMYASGVPDRPEAYTDDKKGGLRYIQYRENTPPEVVKFRSRTLENFIVPANKLRKGVNCLAISIHRSAAPWEFYAARSVGYSLSAYDGRCHAKWTRVALQDVSLSGPGAIPNISAPPTAGLAAWNQNVVRKVVVSDYGDPCEALRPVQIIGARNGTFSGQIVIGDAGGIKGLKVSVSDLKGPGTIPASAVNVRYGLPDGDSGSKNPAHQPFDSLEEAPPEEVKIQKGGTGAVQPLWFIVSVPADAKPGNYQGTVDVTSQGGSVKAAIHLTVIDWALPDYREFAAYTDMFESPESVALAYNVPLWSEEHWKLVEKSFALMGPMATKSVYLTCIRETHLGNEHAMVRWKKGADGKLEPDLSIAEKYLDVAVKHLGKIPTVVLYGWEPPDSMGHGNTFSPEAAKIHDREILITVLGPGGELLKEKAPAWGTPECEEFWRTLVTVMQKALDKRGISKSMLFGLMGDHRPTEATMKQIAKAAPGLEWSIHAHHYCDKWYGVDLGLCASVWGIKCTTVDPDKGHGYGWQNPFRLVKYPRGELNAASLLTNYRTVEENWIGAIACEVKIWPKARGARGLGRQGADFWRVLKNEPEKRDASWSYNTGGRLSARYPATYWGQLCINYGNPAFFGRGKNGAVPTVRSEMIRENAQEIEARVFIEKALLDEAKKATLGADLAKRCQDALDERIRYCIGGGGDSECTSAEDEIWFISSGVQQRMEKLFGLASEVFAKMGGE